MILFLGVVFTHQYNFNSENASIILKKFFKLQQKLIFIGRFDCNTIDCLLLYFLILITSRKKVNYD
jgi:hypothetical protein